MVRTVTVGFRRKDVREPALPYVVKPLQEIQIGVQRIAVILPVEDQMVDVETTSDGVYRENSEVVGTRVADVEADEVVVESLDG